MKGSRTLSKEEVRIVLAACRDIRERTLCMLGLNLGLRIGEMMSLTWQDVWQFGRPVPVLYLSGDRTKGHRARSLPVNKAAAQAIRLLHREMKVGVQEPSGTLFPSRKHRALGIRQAQRVLRKIFRRARLAGHLSAHSFRKTLMTVLSEAGVSIRVIQELCGHSDVSTTQRYIGVGMASMEKALKGLSKSY